MTERSVKVVRWVRMVIYAAMVIAFAGSIAWGELYETPEFEAVDPDSEGEDFWPPDMIPHPGIPERQRESDWA